MKKTIYCIVLCTLSAITPYLYASSFSINSEISVSAYSRDVTVYEIKKRGKMFIVRHVSATYDKESNTLTVDNETYPVRDNPYYGNTDDKRGAYRYVADGRFYFD